MKSHSYKRHASFFLILAAFLLSPPLFADDFVVDSTGTGSDVTPGNGICADVGGECTLTAAIQESNALGGDNGITFDAAVFPDGAGTQINTASSFPTIASNLTIVGANADTVALDGNGAVGRGLIVDSGGAGISVSIVGLEIFGFAGAVDLVNSADSLELNAVNLNQNSTGTRGGGARNQGGTLTIMNSTIDQNLSSMSGGGVATLGGGTTTIEDSTISNNTATFDGGGITNNDSTLFVTASTVSGNSAGAFGGGLCTFDTNSVATINSSVFKNNSAVDSGGGIENRGGSALFVDQSTLFANDTGANGGGIRNGLANSAVTVTNSTISGNLADENGGGISNNGDGTNTVVLLNVTITDNEADADGGGAPGEGGGISQEAGAGDFITANSIIADNIDLSSAPDCHTAGTLIMSDGNNLIGDDTGCADNDFSAGAKNDQIGTGASPIDPLLLAISPANGGDPANGSETGAHTPEDDSPAVDAVDASITPAPAVDQHGGSRPNGAAADIGSIELGGEWQRL